MKKFGRPKNSGKFGVETKVVRVPLILWDDILVFIEKKLKSKAKLHK